jgi:hypothetical protein
MKGSWKLKSLYNITHTVLEPESSLIQITSSIYLVIAFKCFKIIYIKNKLLVSVKWKYALIVKF